MSDLAARVDRVESTEQIRQLASKYALALDMRDIDALVNLYVDDVRINKQVSGRQALKLVFCEVVRAFTASVHHIGNHIIEFDDPDSAHGLVYSGGGSRVTCTAPTCSSARPGLTSYVGRIMIQRKAHGTRTFHPGRSFGAILRAIAMNPLRPPRMTNFWIRCGAANAVPNRRSFLG